MSALLTHLWTSTLVLLVVLVVSRVLPMTARTRYALLFLGLLKFAIPSFVIAAPLNALGLNRQTAGTIVIDWVDGAAPLRALPSPPPASIWPSVGTAMWIIVAIAFALAWMIARGRLVATALNAAKSASPRELTTLTTARRRMNLRTSIDITRSTICEAPAVVRIIRPVILLPDGGCDDLDDAELESLLRHECAHVARRDNLLGAIESAIVAAFWFHPLVWIAQRAISTAREEACDETAAATPEAVDTYTSALSKICGSVLASRLAGVSCMASAHLKERLHHLMNYELLRKRALSHRFVIASAAIAILAVTVVSGIDAAPAPSDERFTLAFKVRPAAVDDREIFIDVRDTGAKVTAVLRMVQNGVTIQESTYSGEIEPATARRYTGAPISMNVKDAELTDILGTFGKLTGLDIQYPATLKGRKVNLNITDMPWDQAFEVVLLEQNLTWEMTGNKMVITPK